MSGAKPGKGVGEHLRVVIKAARKQGWLVEVTRKSHLKFTPPDPTMELVICSGTPSDRFAFRNALTQLKRNGLEV